MFQTIRPLSLEGMMKAAQRNVNIEVPQESVYGPLLYLLYISHLVADDVQVVGDGNITNL